MTKLTTTELVKLKLGISNDRKDRLIQYLEISLLTELTQKYKFTQQLLTREDFKDFLSDMVIERLTESNSSRVMSRNLEARLHDYLVESGRF